MTDTTPCRILVCTHERHGLRAASCGRRGGADVLALLQTEAEAGRLPARVAEGICLGHCTIGPNVKVVGGALLHGVSKHDPAPVREAVAAWRRARCAREE